jgi:hypothetical protein
MTERHFKLASAVLWLALVGVAVFTSPPASPDTTKLIVRMATGQLEGLNLSLFGLFNLMGVWPFAMIVALRFDRPWWKWLFLAGSFALGAFVLLPYFVLRPWLLPKVERRTWLSALLANRWISRAIVVAGVAFTGLFLFGGMGEFAELFRTQQFPYVMTFDCLAFCAAAALLALERRWSP